MISMDKKYRTRAGAPVRLLCVDGPNKQFPVVGFMGDGIATWQLDGRWRSGLMAGGDESDLIEVKPEKVFYGTVYSSSPGGWWPSLDSARASTVVRAGVPLLGFIKLTLVEGEPPRHEFIQE